MIAMPSAGPDAVGADQGLERDPLVTGQEAEQLLIGFADVVVDVQERRRRRFELGERPVRDVDHVPDAPDLDQHRAVEVTFEDLAAERPDHRRAPAAVAAATWRLIGANAR